MNQEQAVQLSPEQQLREDLQRIDEAISILKKIGGGMEFNPYRDTILRLQGIMDCARMYDWAYDL